MLKRKILDKNYASIFKFKTLNIKFDSIRKKQYQGIRLISILFKLSFSILE